LQSDTFVDVHALIGGLVSLEASWTHTLKEVAHLICYSGTVTGTSSLWSAHIQYHRPVNEYQILLSTVNREDGADHKNNFILTGSDVLR
jgi:hypothetical protein